MKAVRDKLCQLEDILPLPYRVVLKFGIPNHERVMGDASVKQDAKGEATGIIRIKAGLSHAEAIETLIHEYAHLLCWGYEGFSEDAIWGLHYSDCYRVAFGKH